MRPLSVLRSRSSWTAITRPGAWGLVPAGSARNATLQASASTAYEARPSMEACGIDVFKTARDNGFPIEVVRSHEETRNIYGVILVE